MKGLKKAKEYIQEAKTIAIACHINPDGDAIGSLLALGIGLESLGKTVILVSQDGVPKKYSHLPGATKVVSRLTRKVDLVITVDCSAPEMLGKVSGDLQKGSRVLEIDHHDMRSPFGDIGFIDPEAAAVGEQVHILLKGLKVRMTREIAQNILTSIIVDTNSFRLPNVRPRTFTICGELMKTGADFCDLVDKVFWSRTREIAILSGICLSRCRFMENGRIVWSVIRQEDFDRVGGQDGDVDPVADEIRTIKGVEIVVLFREKTPDIMRVSLRSKGEINIARLAALFGGGGHDEVAGCKIPNTSRAMESLLDKARDLLWDHGRENVR